MKYCSCHLTCQTYTLTLIKSQGGQKQTPYLFLSPKSFRAAKSTSLSTMSPTGLSPISKLLSKPSLLSKFALIFAPLLLSYAQETQALTEHTSRKIQGSAPYLMFDGGQTKASDTDTFLAIELPDGRTITPSTNTSSLTNPIMLVNGRTFNDIHMVLPPGSDNISLNDLITQGRWGDDDGDVVVTASGSISLAIKDKDGNTVSRGDTLSKCSAPYKVTLSSTGGVLTTKYGVPDKNTFSGGSAVYYIKPDSSGSCYFVQSVRPNLRHGTGKYAGPASIWSPKKGFLVQSTSSSSYDRNFPTTGADGLYFDLGIPTGIDVSQLTWSSVSHSGITATVTMVTANESWIPSVDRRKLVARVKLTGPRASSTQINSSSPSLLSHPSLPQTFELVGRDRSGNEVKYGFKLRQWFVSRGGQRATPSAQTTWCNSLGYRLSRVSDLTNAVRTANPPITGSTPSSSVNYYMRHIGAGFFTEWGYVHNYTNAGFFHSHYWARDASGSNNHQFAVRSHDGSVHSHSASGGLYAVCTTL